MRNGVYGVYGGGSWGVKIKNMLIHLKLVCYIVSICLNPIHSVVFYHIALSIQTCHMLMAEPSTYDMFALLKKNGYVDGWAVNIWHVFVSKHFYFKIWKYKLVICWWLSRQHMTCFHFWKRMDMLTAELSTYDMFLLKII